MSLSTYVLADPDSGEIRYVGLTSKTPEERLRGHMAGRFKDPKFFKAEKVNFDAWLGRLGHEGKAPVPILIATCNVERAAYLALKQSGARLFNKQTPHHPKEGEPK